MTKQASPGTPSTRERILAHLQEHHTATVVGLSRAWGLTRADIRYHLNSLLEERVIELVPRDPTQELKRGRPVQTYRLAARSLPGNLAALCGAALKLLMDAPDAEKEARLRQIAQLLAGRSLPAAGSSIQRLNQVVGVLNQRSYRARWEAHASGPRILLRSCPYAALLKEHPELCKVDRYFIEHLLQAPLRHAAKMDLETGKSPACIFFVTPPEP